MRPSRIVRTTSFRLAAIYAGVFGASVLALIVVIYWIATEAMGQQLRAGIEAEVAALVEHDRAGGVTQVADAIRRRLASRRRATMYYLLTDPAGRKIAGNLLARPPHAGWSELRDPSDEEGDIEDGTAQSDERLVVAWGAGLADGTFLIVGEDTSRVVEAQEAILAALAWAVSATVLLATVGGIVVSLGFLRRVDAINRTSRAIIDGQLAQRIPTRGTDDDLDQLARNLNEMLDRIQALMESVRHVSNDIAHDLRTPLSRLRQRLESARLRARSVSDYEVAVDHAIADADAILATFAALLRIAQIESGSRKAAFTTVDLSGIFRSIVEAYGPVAEDRGQALASMIEPGIAARGDRELLTQMLANLVENAIRHAPADTRIAVELRDAARGPVGIVADTGPGIPADERARVFERFYRLERSRTSPGSGLGLALVAAVAQLHGIGVELQDNDPGLRVVLAFEERRA